MSSQSGSRLQDLLNSVKPRAIAIYKTYLIQYGTWCKDNELIHKYSNEFKPKQGDTFDTHVDVNENDKNGEAVIYKHLPISTRLIHQFLIDTIIRKNPTSKITKGQSFRKYSDDIIQILNKWIIGLIFISKLCDIYGNFMIRRYPIDEQYLFRIIDLFKTINVDPKNKIPFYKISINSWNPTTPNLNMLYFKTANEKFRFLVDFHFTTYLKLSFQQRSNLILTSLKVKNNKHFKIHTPHNDNTNNLDIIYYDPRDDMDQSDPTIQPRALVPHQSPFICPYTSLASYLFLRFYGIRYFAKGEGFPNLFDETFMSLMPLLRGKASDEIPKEGAIGACYSTMFKYCDLPYKKRNYFISNDLVYPSWQSNDESVSFFKFFKDEIVPWDYMNIFNGQDPFNPNLEFQIGDQSNIPSQSIINKVFPEIETYKSNWNKLSTKSQDFIKLMEVLRIKFVIDLPIIYKIFPENEIFINPLFKDAEFQTYLNGIQLKDNEKLPFDPYPSFDFEDDNYKENMNLFDFYNDLVEPPTSKAQMEKDGLIPSGEESIPPLELKIRGYKGKSNENITNVASVVNQNQILEEFRKQNFKFIQYQTLSNFESFMELISKIFDGFALRDSSKLEIERKMNIYKQLINQKIQESTPSDIKHYFIKNQSQENDVGNKKKKVTLEDLKSESESETDFASSDEGSDSEGESDTQNTTQSRQKKVQTNTKPFKLHSVGGDSSDEDESKTKSQKVTKKTNYDSSDLSDEDKEDSSDENAESSGEEESDEEEQLKDLINQLVTTKVNTVIKRQIDIMEDRIESMVDSLVESKFEDKFDTFMENKMKRTIENYLKDHQSEYNGYQSDTYQSKRIKRMDSNFAQRVQKKADSLGLTSTFGNEDTSVDTYSHPPSHEITSKDFVPDDTDNKEDITFRLDPSINSIEEIVLEWFTPNTRMNDECVHSMNKKYGKTWRTEFDALYKIRKNIVDYYVYLTNIELVDKLKAISYCKDLQGDKTIKEFSKFLRSYKKSHDHSFKGLFEP